MSKLEKEMRNYAADMEEEYTPGTSVAGTSQEFCDYLDEDQAEMFHQMKELAEQKKKWLRLFEKMQKSIQAREFDEAYISFEVLIQEMF